MKGVPEPSRLCPLWPRHALTGACDQYYRVDLLVNLTTDEATSMNDERKNAGKRSDPVESDNPSPSRRELVRKLSKAAALPIVIGSFLVGDVSDSAAN